MADIPVDAQQRWAHHFWRGCFSDSEGTPSFSRVATALVVLASLVWVTRIVYKTGALPDFGGLSLLIGTLYALGQAVTVANALAGNKPPTPPAP